MGKIQKYHSLIWCQAHVKLQNGPEFTLIKISHSFFENMDFFVLWRGNIQLLSVFSSKVMNYDATVWQLTHLESHDEC